MGDKEKETVQFGMFRRSAAVLNVEDDKVDYAMSP